MSASAARDTRLRPLVAMRAMRRLMATGDTAQVFVILRAMRGRSGLRAFRRFAASTAGATVLRERRDLLSTLADREGLARLPSGSLGRTYLAFMEEEDLSAQGLVDASGNWEHDPMPPDAALFRNRMRELHDVNHTVTGYGRDPLGELCLLTFMYRQTGNLGMLLMVAMSWGRLPAQGRRAVREAWRHGKEARWLPEQDWEALLARPLDDVRRALNIAAPVLYRPTAA